MLTIPARQDVANGGNAGNGGVKKHPGQAHEGGEGEKGGKKAPKNAPKDSTLLHLIMGNLIRGS